MKAFKLELLQDIGNLLTNQYTYNMGTLWHAHMACGYIRDRMQPDCQRGPSKGKSEENARLSDYGPFKKQMPHSQLPMTVK